MTCNIITTNSKNLYNNINISGLPEYIYEIKKHNSISIVEFTLVDLIITLDKRINNIDKLFKEIIIEYNKTKYYVNDVFIENITNKKDNTNVKYKLVIGFFSEDENIVKKFLNKVK